MTPRYRDRRTVLKTIGAGLVGGATVSGTATARGNIVSKINSDGHWAYFPLGPDSWGRSKNPYDIRQGDSRWMAKPDSGGSVRCLVKGLPANRNAGFDVHVGQLGDIERVTIDAETVEGPGTFFVGLYLDADDDGDFFAWNDGRGNTDTWDSFGQDSEGAIFPTTEERITIDDRTSFTLFHVGDGPNLATLKQLKDGKVDGIEDETIDAETHAAIYVGALSGGKGTEEEIIVNSVTVDRA